MSRGDKLKTCVGYWGHLLLTGNQSSMIAELQDLYRERTNFSTGVNRQSFTVSGGAALVYTSREFEVKSLIYFGCLELKVWVTALQKHPENRVAAEGHFWLGLAACLLHRNSTPWQHSRKNRRRQWPFSFCLGDSSISVCPISFQEFLVQLTALKTKATVVILLARLSSAGM